MNSPRLSVIIPTHNRRALLSRTVHSFTQQAIDPSLFEVVIVNDGGEPPIGGNFHRGKAKVHIHNKPNGGPASARNFGAAHASGDILLFVGDDCLATPHLVWRHFYDHFRDDGWKVVQGYTIWHHEIPPDDFMIFLTDETGIQANWPALKNPDGSWRRDAPGWFLTTNVSISRGLFDQAGGFDERFPHACWEDIELAARLSKIGTRTIFDPDALNLHHHAITLDSYIQRQITEGKSRLILCALHPEFAGSSLDPKAAREFNEDKFLEMIALAHSLHFEKQPELQQIRRQAWANVLRWASIKGIREGLRERGGLWQAVAHTHSDEVCRSVVLAATSVEAKDFPHAQFEMGICLKNEPDNWALRTANAEILLAMGSREPATAELARALELAPSEEWPALLWRGLAHA